MRLWPALALLGACVPLPDRDAVFDPDGDGSPYGEDCDSTDPAVSPLVAEVPYDGVDNDCEPLTPDDDLDGDSALAAEDCDDTNAAINPTASDATQDGVDQNCDGVDGTDLDGDGVASEATGGTDCDDDDPATHPATDSVAAAEEVCGDGVVNGCAEGLEAAWACSPTGDSTGAVQAALADTEGLVGLPSLAVVDLDGDGGLELALGGPALGGAASPGAIYVLPGATLGSGALGSPALLGADGDRLGARLVVVDGLGGAGDGLLVSAEGREEVWLLGWAAGALELRAALIGDEPSLAWGAALGASGADAGGWVAVGAPTRDAGGTGQVLLFDAGAEGTQDSAAALLTLEGVAGSGFGSVLAVGDLSGDGRAELVVGAPDAAVDEDAAAGQLVVFRGRDATLDPEGAPLEGGTADMRLGEALALGDLSGDGLGDLAVLAPGAGGGGGVFVFAGPLEGGVTLGDAIGIWTAPAGEGLTGGLGLPGDVDDDGAGDLLLGSADSGADPAVWLLYGPPEGTAVVGEGREASARVPGAVAIGGFTGGDLNADGASDVVFGVSDGEGLGGVWLLLGAGY